MLSTTNNRKYRVRQFFFTILLITCPLQTNATCEDIERTVENSQDTVQLIPPLSYEVTGQGRLYFHTAPSEGCRMKEVFVISGDSLIAYSEYKDWYRVMYINTKVGNDAQGWVQSKRLKLMGRIAPE